MSGPAGSQHWMYASGGFYPYSIDQSLRLQNGVTQNLTVSSAFPTATDRKKVTVSFWYKRALSGPNAEFPYRVGVNGLIIQFNTNGTMYLYDLGAGSGGWQITSSTTDRLHRDPSAWYHFALILDSTQATDSDRAKLYVNGEHWSFSTWSVGAGASRYPTLNATFNAHTGSSTTVLTTGTSGCDGYVAEFMSIDGQDVTIDDLGETVNGVWVAKEYTGSFGNAGFHLDFADSSAIGNDVSGNNVDFTADAGFAAHDVVSDTPTNNHCVLNPLDAYNSGSQLSDGNLQYTGDSVNGAHCGTHSFDIANEKFYWEVTAVGTNTWVGIVSEDFSGAQKSGNVYSTAGLHVINTANGHKSQNPYSSTTAFMSAMSANDVLGIACGEGNIEFFINGVSQGDAYTGMTGRYKPFAMSATSAVTVFNFGQTSFSYTAPTDYLSLNSENMPELDIGPNSSTQADDYFNTVLYTGTGVARSITGVGFQPDFVWVKERSSTSGHILFDSVRGVLKFLQAQDSAVETTDSEQLSSFDSDGWSVGASTGINQSGVTNVAWNWKAGGTAVSNTDGSITSSVSANQDAGFSIVSYTGTGSNATVGHGLSSAPDMVIVKNRDAADNWAVGAIPGGIFSDHLQLNSTAAKTSAAAVFNGTNPTATVFSIGTNHKTNASGEDYIAYCFNSVEGHSKIDTYIGNANTDGTFVYTGFRPAWVMIKNTADVTHWAIWDSKRVAYNVNDTALYPSSTDGDQTGTALYVDFLSNGFKWRASHNSVNGSNDTFIYLAFAEAPFKYANAR